MTGPEFPTSTDAAALLDEPNPWAVLGADIAAAVTRDQAAGIRGWESPRLAALVRAYLAPWLGGDAEPNTHGLTNALNMGQRFRQSYDLAERETADRWLTMEAQLSLAAECSRVGHREVSFVLRPEGGGKYGAPRVSVRGSGSRTFFLGADGADGVLALHSHPTADLTPSDTDLDLMSRVLGLWPHSGFGIISQDASRLYMLRDPQPLSVTPALPAEAR